MVFFLYVVLEIVYSFLIIKIFVYCKILIKSKKYENKGGELLKIISVSILEFPSNLFIFKSTDINIHNFP